MIKNILILTLVVINGTLIYAYLTRQPTTTVKHIERAAQTIPKPLASTQQQAPLEIALLPRRKTLRPSPPSFANGSIRGLSPSNGPRGNQT